MSSDLRHILKSVLSEAPVRFAVLYGSYARGTALPVSDVDVAVYVTDANTLFDLSVQLAEALPEYTVDLVNLKNKTAVFYYEALASGEVLIMNDEAFFKQESYRVMREYLDFKPVLDRLKDDMMQRIENGTYGRPVE